MTCWRAEEERRHSARPLLGELRKNKNISAAGGAGNVTVTDSDRKLSVGTGGDVPQTIPAPRVRRLMFGILFHLCSDEMNRLLNQNLLSVEVHPQ